LEHQSSDHEELTHADCPPFKVGWSATWESVLSGLRPRKSVVQVPKNTQSLPKQIWHLRTVRRPWPNSPHNNIGTVLRATISGQDCGRSGPKARMVRSTIVQDQSEMNYFGPHWMDRGRSAHLARTVRQPHDLATFQACFQKDF
jgi:hypothetical protein